MDKYIKIVTERLESKRAELKSKQVIKEVI